MNKRIFTFLIYVSFSILIYADGWNDIDYDGEPWTKNISEPLTITHGLQNRHLSVWASHGIYYDKDKNRWKWQRPALFLTREDLFTQTIVIPYLIPMLENAGANVFTPRERDWQRNEVIVDNDIDENSHYFEENRYRTWEYTDSCGFIYHNPPYLDNENPFRGGTARMVRTTTKKKISSAAYVPTIPEAGNYAVYVSYQTRKNSIDNAHYIVWHQGERTDFHVNQKMGGGTWVYLGTFYFDAGGNENNCVVIMNDSKHKGVVTTDAVRFGGGMGNILRGDNVSGYPRCFEGARYYAQWAGMPYPIYSSKNGNDDYGDDINSRSLMTNNLAGGSVFMPTIIGKKVPIELSLAVHTDAGYHYNSKDIIGSMSICTTDKAGNSTYDSGLSREMGKEFAGYMLGNLFNDLKRTYGNWIYREVRDKNYSESRVPEVPCAIIEALSHQNFADIKMAHDANFKFTLARSLYKSILRFVTSKHDKKSVVTPLPPKNLRVEMDDKGEAEIAWSAQEDSLETTATSDSYIIYIQMNNGPWDNGQKIKNTAYSLRLQPNIQYNFRIVAVNEGGKSFPSEILSAFYYPKARGKVMIVNGFHRLSAPATIETSSSLGFDVDEDPGVWEGINPGFCGRQAAFSRTNIGSELKTGLGYSNSDFIGQFLMGNENKNIVDHTSAIANCKRVSVCSSSSEALEANLVDLGKYKMVDLILGNEKDSPSSLLHYKTFSKEMQTILKTYTSVGGSVMVSGSYIASDMKDSIDSVFMANVFGLRYSGSESFSDYEKVKGMGISFDIYRTLNEKHYATTRPDILSPIAPAFAVMTYDTDGFDACVAYETDKYRTMAFGFPFECIKNKSVQASLMTGILDYLIPMQK